MTRNHSHDPVRSHPRPHSPLTPPAGTSPTGGLGDSEEQQSPDATDEFLPLSEEFLERYRQMLLAPPRQLVSTTAPRSVYLQIQSHPGGSGRFIEESVQRFDGDLEALLTASVTFIEHRKRVAKTDPTLTVSGRIGMEAATKLRRILDSLTPIRGISRSRILAGLIQLRLFPHNP